MPRLSKIGAAALAAFGWTSGGATVTASYLVVAGGGGGGYNGGGGGGAGGYRTGTGSLNPSLSYTVTVGAGGASSAANNVVASNGSDSIFSTITSAGGGGGIGNNSGGSTNGAAGGSGGGGGAFSSGGAGNTPSTSPSQGNNGGTGGDNGGTNYGAGGGGGASAVGGNRAGSAGGAGGAGSANSISGTSVTYAGGGGGCGGVTAGTGGSGGGGAGGTNSTVGTSGTANLGGGAGGGGSGLAGGQGGSGIVIISYAGAQQFGGGVVTSVGGNTIHTFTTSGTLSPITPLTASYLVVAGGGGGAIYGGGGGAGGLLSGSGLLLDTNSIYAVTVGAGGAGTGTQGVTGVSGSNSAFYSVTSTGGGGAGAFGTGTTGSVGLSGGSGGGGGQPDSGGTVTGAGGAGTSGQGNAGGAGITDNSSYRTGGGGGGASAVGANSTSANGGNGGNGTASSISGSSVTYAGGGGGGTNTSGRPAGTGGTGGGGTGGAGSANGSNGTANLGGGAGGAGALTGGSGGSGVVIISYAGSQVFAGGTVTSSGGNTIHTFTSSGYLTPIKLVNNSLRFRGSAGAYLNRTQTSSVTNNKIYTLSAWVKRGTLGSNPTIFQGADTLSASIYSQLLFASDTLYFGDYNGSSNALLQTTALYRDPAAWYHVVANFDSTQATSSERMKLYVNGVQVTSFTTANYPTLNATSPSNFASYLQRLGQFYQAGTAYNQYDGYMTEMNFIDGQALTPSSFGTFNSYGVWQPITYGGSYGTNGFYLPFTNNASTTTLGYDFSPQGNNWTTNNISLTAGVTYDSMTDVPTLTSATAANYAVWNPLDTSSNGTLSRANLQSTSVGFISGKASIAVSAGKWYWEITCTGGNFSGVGSHIGLDSVTSPCSSAASVRLGNTATSYSYNSWNGSKLSNSVSTAYGSTYTNGDVISVALDLDSGKIWWAKNGTFQASGDPAAGTNAAYSSISAGLYTIAVGDDGGGGIVLDLNCGQQPFTYTPPSGFVALNTYNL
jgi:hypothetical protein